MWPRNWAHLSESTCSVFGLEQPALALFVWRYSSFCHHAPQRNGEIISSFLPRPSVPVENGETVVEMKLSQVGCSFHSAVIYNILGDEWISASVVERALILIKDGITFLLSFGGRRGCTLLPFERCSASSDTPSPITLTPSYITCANRQEKWEYEVWVEREVYG